MRDLREVRMAKLRAGVDVLEGGREVKMNGVGGMEIAEGRAFIVGVVDGLRSVFFFFLEPPPPLSPILARRGFSLQKGGVWGGGGEKKKKKEKRRKK